MKTKGWSFFPGLVRMARKRTRDSATDSQWMEKACPRVSDIPTLMKMEAATLTQAAAISAVEAGRSPLKTASTVRD